MSSLGSVRERLERRTAGELNEDELALLVRDAGRLARRLDRLKALYPDLGDAVELGPELAALCPRTQLTASG